MKAFTGTTPGIVWPGLWPDNLAMKFGDFTLRLPNGKFIEKNGKPQLMEVSLPGEKDGEVLLLVVSSYGYRGHSDATAISGAVEIAKVLDTASPAGSLGYGYTKLFRVAVGGIIESRQTGRRVEEEHRVMRFINTGGAVAVHYPLVEKKEKEMLSLLHTSPVPVPAEVAESLGEALRENASLNAEAARLLEAATTEVEGLKDTILQRNQNLREATERLREALETVKRLHDGAKGLWSLGDILKGLGL